MDGHNFPNFALMRVAGYYRNLGYGIEMVDRMFGGYYDKIFSSKIFTFTPDYEYTGIDAGEILMGGTGYDIKGRLPEEIEKSTLMDYSIYPKGKYPFSVQFFSRGCIRHCPFCLVREKEGYIHPVEPVQLNPDGKWIEVLDNNFFANPEWHSAVDYLLKQKQPVAFHGVDIRIMNEEQAYYLNKIKMRGFIHIAWDLPKIDLEPQIKEMIKHVKPFKIICYVLVGFNSTVEQDLHRLEVLKKYGITPFVQPYRDYENKRKPTQYERDLARWANRTTLFKSFDFKDFYARKDFKCDVYLKHSMEELGLVQEMA